MWFRNLKIYRITNWNLDLDELNKRLSDFALSDIGSAEYEVKGWVPPKSNESKLFYGIPKSILIAFGTTKKILPASVISQYVKQKVQDIEDKQAYKPSRKEIKEIKENVTFELLPRAFSLSKKVYVWIDLNNNLLLIDSASQAVADEVISLLHKSLIDIELKIYATNQTPRAVMSSWFLGEDVPSMFSIDDDCELKAIGENKASIKYSNHALSDVEITNQINTGKEIVKLALTWKDKVSFVIQDNFCLRKIKPLDILLDEGESDEDSFDTDFRLMQGELSHLISDLDQVFNK